MSLIYIEELFFTIAFVAYIIGALGFFIYISSCKEPVGRLSIMITVLGFIIHTIAMIARIIESGRLPFSNQFEFANSFTWGIVLCYLLLHYYYHFTAIGAFVMPLAFLMMGYASVLPKTIRPLMPALQSRWLTIHVGSAVISYGAFAVSCGISIIYLLSISRQRNAELQLSPSIEETNEDSTLFNSKPFMKNRQSPPHQTFHASKKLLPNKEICDYLSYRVIAFGYFMLTIVIISGAIWARSAWSRYWGWDPKETWSLITWIIYSVYLHLRFNKGWRGKPAAWFAIIGFICVIFTFIGVSALLPGIHSYR